MAGTKVKKSQLKRFIDAFVILIEATYGMSMLKVWFVDPLSMPWDVGVTLLMMFLYFIRFKGKFSLLTGKGNLLPKLLLIIYVVDVFQVLLISSMAFAFSRGVFMLNIYFFMEYLVSLDKENYSSVDSVSSITKPYEIYSLYNVIVVLLCGVLILTGFLSSTDNPMVENSMIKGNLADGTIYYFPGHLSIAMSSFRALSYIGIPVLTGLSHEPHVIWWIVGPCFFLLLDRYRGKSLITVLLVIAFFLLSILSTSFTAVVAFVVTLLMEFLYTAFLNNKKSFYIPVFFVGIIVFLYVLSKNEFIVDALSLMVDEKTSEGVDEGSLGYSVSGLSYMISPKSLLGWGNVTDIGWGFDLKGANIGYITFALDMVLFIMLYVKSFKLFLCRDNHIHYIGMACLYFLFHSLKMGTQVFTFPYFTFFIVIISLTSRFLSSNKREQLKS